MTNHPHAENGSIREPKGGLQEIRQGKQPKGAAVLVAGATGFVGVNVTRALINQGHRVYAVARNKDKLRQLLGMDDSDRLTILQSDLLDKQDLVKLEYELANRIETLDFVVQTIGGGPLTSNPVFADGIFDLNYRTTCNLVRILETSGKLASLKLFVYFSSLAAMGMPQREGKQILYSEVSACNPVLPYEKAKFETETFLRDVANKHRLKTVVLRFPQIYGGSDDAFMQMIGLIRKGLFPVIRDRVGTLPLIGIRDVVGATLAIILNPDKTPGNYGVQLVCEGSHSYSRLVDVVRKKYGHGGMLRIPYSLMYIGTAFIERAFRVLGKPEPLNRRRLISLTKDRVVDCMTFVRTFQFEFQENAEKFIASHTTE